MTAKQLTESLAADGRKRALEATSTYQEAFLVGWLGGALENAIAVLMKCDDPAAKSHVSLLQSLHPDPDAKG